MRLEEIGLIGDGRFAPGAPLRRNLPQAISHVGLIRAAFEASPAWKDVP